MNAHIATGVLPMSDRHRWFGIGLGLLVGAGIGAALGLLLAPRSGSESRLQMAEDLRETQARTRRYLGQTRHYGTQSMRGLKHILGAKYHLIKTAVQAGRIAARRSWPTSKEIVG